MDHLSCLRALLRDAKVIHMYAPFSLVRAALENACAAVWMLQPPRRADRLARRLRFAVTDIHNGEQVKQVIGQPGPRSACSLSVPRTRKVRSWCRRPLLDAVLCRR